MQKELLILNMRISKIKNNNNRGIRSTVQFVFMAIATLCWNVLIDSIKNVFKIGKVGINSVQIVEKKLLLSDFCDF